jgi:thioesterase domain-containing protein/aryl carrier-like protein
VAVPQKQILNRLHWMWQAYPFAPDEVGCQKTALSFVDAIWEIFGPLLQGIPTVILPDDVVKDPLQMVAALAQKGVTRLWFVPSFLRVLLEAVPNLQAKLPKLNFWVTSGEPIGWELYKAFKAQLPQAEMYNLYGTSEVWDATWYVPDAAHASLPFMPIGQPIANMQTLILDNAGQPAPVGVVGELCVGGTGLGWGYLNRPELTAEKFIPHPLSSEPGARLYRTGDLACYLSDGQIAFIGRRDHQVKIRGYRVECGEVETALRRLPGVQNCAVVAQERPYSPGEQQLVAFVVPEDVAEPDIATLRQQLQNSLPNFMIPTLFQLVTSLPLTPSGKINRQALPQADTAIADSPAGTVAPRTPVEAQLVSLWEEVLQRQPIGVTDNFFDLGGHSLLAVRLFARLNKRFAQKLPLAVLFTAPTIAALAELMTEKTGQQAWSSLVPIQPIGGKRPFFFVHGGAGQVFHYRELAEALGAERPFYGLQPQGWDQHRVAVPTVPQLAAAYLAEIRTVQPTGPYHLGGYCFGGLIAFEMARQLQAHGETVATLAIIDPSPIKHISQAKSTQNGPPPRWQRHQQALARRTFGEKVRYVFTSGRHRFQAIAKVAKDNLGITNLKRMALRLFLLTGQPVPEKWRDFYLMELVSRSAGRSYVPNGRFAGHIDLFLATRAAITWPLAATDGADIKHLAADHLSILKEPHIQVIAQTLQSQLASQN